MRVCLVGKKMRDDTSHNMEDARNFNTSWSQYEKNLDWKAFDRHKPKLQYCKGAEQIPDPHSISEGREKELESWPDLTYGDINWETCRLFPLQTCEEGYLLSIPIDFKSTLPKYLKHYSGACIIFYPPWSFHLRELSSFIKLNIITEDELVLSLLEIVL